MAAWTAVSQVYLRQSGGRCAWTEVLSVISPRIPRLSVLPRSVQPRPHAGRADDQRLHLGGQDQGDAGDRGHAAGGCALPRVRVVKDNERTLKFPSQVCERAVPAPPFLFPDCAQQIAGECNAGSRDLVRVSEGTDRSQYHRHAGASQIPELT